MSNRNVISDELCNLIMNGQMEGPRGVQELLSRAGGLYRRPGRAQAGVVSVRKLLRTENFCKLQDLQFYFSRVHQKFVTNLKSLILPPSSNLLE